MPIINENREQAIVHLFTAQLVLKKRIEPILRLQQHGALTKSIYLTFSKLNSHCNLEKNK